MFNITIDGLAGCGKSTMSRLLSQALGLKCLNTGSIYRAITCHFLANYTEQDICDSVIEEFVKNMQVAVSFDSGKQVVTICGIDYSSSLRDEKVSNITPIISGYLAVREKVRDIQRDFATDNDCVVEGRDIGTVVLPNAQCKLFFIADSRVRAMRRLEQMKNVTDAPPFNEILRDLERRDEEDRDREYGAMIPASDAIIVDNTNDSIEQTLSKCIKIVEEKRKA